MSNVLVQPDNGQDHRARTVIVASNSARKPGFACIRLLSDGFGGARYTAPNQVLSVQSGLLFYWTYGTYLLCPPASFDRDSLSYQISCAKRNSKMRIIFLFLVAVSTVCNGCSLYLNQAGPMLPDFESRQEAWEEFGKPQVIEQSSVARYDEFLTRNFYADYSPDIPMGYLGTAGAVVILEPLYLTVYSYKNLKRLVFGDRYRVEYNEKDEIIRLYKNGNFMWSNDPDL